MRRAFLLSLGALFLLSAAASAQTRPQRAAFRVETAAWATGVELPALDVIPQPQAGQASRSRMVLGGAVGFVLGAGVTYAFLSSGGSTSLCDRDANQDAMARKECVAITVGGGVTGAALGALVAWVTRPGR